MKIKCKICKVDLTKNLQILSDKKLLNTDDGADFVPKGLYYSCEEDEYFNGSENKIIINVNELINAKHHDTNLSAGCCGADGTDGINIMCLNGHEIATIRNDCWMAHAVTFENDKIITS